MQPKKLVMIAKEASLDKKGEEPVILDLQKFNTVARYFLIVHGNSYPHVKAIADHILEKSEMQGIKAFHVEGMDEGLWVLIDFGSVIAHVFYRPTREFYALERLWGDAPKL